MKNVKLFVSCCTLNHGGAERVLSILSSSLADSFAQVSFLMWVDAPVFYQIDTRVRLINITKQAGSSRFLPRMRWFRRFIIQERPNLILSFLAPFNMLVLASLLGIRTKVIVAERNDPHFLRGGRLMEKARDALYGRAECILAQTDNIKSYFKGKLNEKTVVIYNPVLINPSLVGSGLLVQKQKRIVSVARLEKQKRHDVLIRAFARFYLRHQDYSLTIYGDGPLRENLAALVHSLGMEGKVSLPGVSKTVMEEIRDAELFVLASTHEGMSNAMLEAMCIGLPCLCTRVSGAVDLIEDGKNGMLVDVNDENGLVEKMTFIIEHPEIRQTIGLEAVKVYEKLRADIISKQWIDVLDSFIDV
ncbi:MAG: glycosyltransferase [Bacteroidales bacterium]|nr:glycosyltransferase [Bacteroidales bacterium]